MSLSAVSRSTSEPERVGFPDPWPALDAVLARAPDFDALRHHGLHLLAARRLRGLGQPIPPGVVDEQRAAAAMGLVAPLVLRAVREAVSGEILLMKGPEVGAYYPDPSTRPFTDLDVVVADPAGVHRALRAAGFVEVGDPALYVDIHHLRPLVLPELPVPVEVHAHPKWVSWRDAPDVGELLRAAVPCRTGVEGVVTLSPAQHALILAVHSWAHEPLRRVADVLDVAAVAYHADGEELEAIALAWGIARLWHTTAAVSGALFGERAPALAARVWGAGVLNVRERTVLEAHLESWFSPFSALPRDRAALAMGKAMLMDIRRDKGDSWPRKAQRSSRAILNAFRGRSHHHRTLDGRGEDSVATDRTPR